MTGPELLRNSLCGPLKRKLGGPCFNKTVYKKKQLTNKKQLGLCYSLVLR